MKTNVHKQLLALTAGLSVLVACSSFNGNEQTAPLLNGKLPTIALKAGVTPLDNTGSGTNSGDQNCQEGKDCGTVNQKSNTTLSNNHDVSNGHNTYSGSNNVVADNAGVVNIIGGTGVLCGCSAPPDPSPTPVPSGTPGPSPTPTPMPSGTPVPSPTPTLLPTCITPPSEMVAWYTGDGNSRDMTGNGHHGTLQNGLAFTTGKVAQAFNLDGIDDFLRVSSVALPNGLSYDAWIRTTSSDDQSDSGREGNVALHIIGDDSGAAWHSFGVNGGKVSYKYFNDNIGPWQTVTGATTVNDGNWHHVAVTHNSSTGLVTLYVDGIQDATDTITYEPDRTSFNVVGTGYLGDYFNGSLDEIEVFSRPLAASEIQSIFNAGSYGKCKP